MGGGGSRSILVWDGDCGFCRRAVLWLERWCGPAIELRTLQEWTPPGVTRDELERAVHLVEPDGRTTRAAEACFRALSHAPGLGFVLLLYRFPPLAWISELVYGFVAGHRRGISRMVRWVGGPDPEPSSFLVSRRLHLGLLGLVLAWAFLDLWLQLPGLIGSEGILALPATFGSAGGEWTLGALQTRPSLFWFGQSDGFLHTVTGAGLLGALAAAVGVMPLWGLLLGFVCYLSLVQACGVFTDFAQDALLLEACFLGVLASPAGFLPRRAWHRVGMPVALLLQRFLLFRVLFVSGLAKLVADRSGWLDGSALAAWLQTQPLPGPLADDLAASPSWLLAAASWAVLAVELVAPWLLFGLRRMRLLAVLAILLHQFVTVLAGSQGYLPVLVMVLALTALDDQSIHRLFPALLRTWHPRQRFIPSRAWTRWLRICVAGVVVLLGVGTSIRDFVPQYFALDTVRGQAFAQLASLRVLQGHVLVPASPGRRVELVLEGLDRDGDWQPLPMAAKPADVFTPPGWHGLSSPRLDLALWSQSRAPEGQAWVPEWVRGLLEGRDAVWGLHGADSRPDPTPEALRVQTCEFAFESGAVQSRFERYWLRQDRGVFVPPVELGADGQLTELR